LKITYRFELSEGFLKGTLGFSGFNHWTLFIFLFDQLFLFIRRHLPDFDRAGRVLAVNCFLLWLVSGMHHSVVGATAVELRTFADHATAVVLSRVSNLMHLPIFERI
jgi:hypothetical protein